MAQITLKGNPVETSGTLPAVGTAAPTFSLTKTDLSDTTLADYKGNYVVLNIFPSIDTPVCAASVRRFNSEASSRENSVVLCVSADLPFAHGRFCEGEGLKDVIPLSTVRSQEFGKEYGVVITSGPLAGFLSRAIVIVDGDGKVVYVEQVPEITEEPDYDAALKALG